MYNTDFYDNLDLKYPEIAVALETYGNKFNIPILTPFIANAGKSPSKSTASALNKNNIKNKDSLPISRITTQNYVTLSVPSYLGTVHKGDKFIIVFVGGDINKIRIIGRY